MRKQGQPVETYGKVISYKANGRWHVPYYADHLNWTSKHTGRIEDYKLTNLRRAPCGD